MVIDNNKIPEILEKWKGFLLETRDTLAAMVENAIILQFPEQGPNWAPLHPFTIRTKGSTGILVDTGQMRNSIMIHPDDIATIKTERRVGIFVAQSGFHVDERRFPKTQQRDILVAQIAQIHEFGAIINITPRMRRFLHAAGLHVKATTTQIVIPERSFLRKGWDEIEPQLMDTISVALETFFLSNAIDVI